MWAGLKQNVLSEVGYVSLRQEEDFLPRSHPIQVLAC